MFDFGVSTCLYSVFKPAVHIPLLSTNGARWIECAGNAYQLLASEPSCTELHKQLQNNNLKLYSVHVPFSAEDDLSHPDTEQRKKAVDKALLCLEQGIRLKACCLIIHAGGAPVLDNRSLRLEYAKESIRFLVEKIPQDSDIQLAVELLPGDWLLHDADEMLAFLKGLNAGKTGICLDANHANLREDLCEATVRMNRHIISTHVSDNDGKDDCHLLPGNGIINWQAWADALVQIDYQGPLMYEVKPWGNLTDEELTRAVYKNYQQLFSRKSV